MARDGNRQRGVAARGPGCENRMPAGGERAGSNVGVCASIVRVGEKVQHRRIVPEIEVSGREREFQHISHVPRDPIRALTEPVSSERQCLLRDIQDADIAKTPVEQVIDERRGARAHIDHARAGGQSGLLEKLQRHIQVGLIPADRIGALGPIDVLPVGSAIIVRIDHIDTRWRLPRGRIEARRRQVKSRGCRRTGGRSMIPDKFAKPSSARGPAG